MSLTVDDLEAIRGVIRDETEALHNDVKEIYFMLSRHGKRLDSHDKRFDAHDKRFDSHDKRFDAHDKRFDDHDKRFDKIDSNLAKLDIKLTNHMHACMPVL